MWRMLEVQQFLCFATQSYYKEIDSKLKVRQTDEGPEDKKSGKDTETGIKEQAARLKTEIENKERNSKGRNQPSFLVKMSYLAFGNIRENKFFKKINKLDCL